MATKTTNYGLTKPEGSDFYDIDVHNGNSDIIDAQLKKLYDAKTGHVGNKSNPHSVTKSQIGLGNVENKSSATIREEMTKANVTKALGYTPATQSDMTNAQNAITQLNSDLKDALVTQYAELNGTGNNYFYVDRKQGYRLSSAILHVYDTGYIRVEAISQEVNNENCYVLWTNNSYPQNKKIGCDLVWIKENFLWN